MGKKGTKRKTRWRALPLGEDDAGSGNEEELLDEDRSTSSSLAGQTTNVKVHPPVFRLGERSYRPQRRFHYDRFRSKEPIIKLESKTFDEEEYTKITTPRQDVLFKKGYFGRKRESSIEETLIGTGEVDGEETLMDQYIITNGFLDERGHYYVNGSSYEVYDPYSNTVTVVVGPPPYTNGVNQPVLAAVSCQPVPLTPVEWYPPGSDWPTHGSAWTPSYPQGEFPMNGDASPSFAGHDPSLYQQSAYVEFGHPYKDNQAPGLDGGPTPEQSNAVPNTKDSNPEEQNKTTGANNPALPDDKRNNQEVISNPPAMEAMTVEDKNAAVETAPHMRNGAVVNAVPTSEPQMKQQHEEQPRQEEPPTVKPVEKQSHSTQTSTSAPAAASVTPSPIKVKESHSTQTMPEESPVVDQPKEIKKAPEPAKMEQSPKLTWKKVENSRREENGKRFHQKRMNEEHKPKPENSENAPVQKISYARKLLNGLENPANKTGNSVRAPSTNGTHAVPAHASESYKSPAQVNLSGKRPNTDKFSPGEGKRNNVWNGNVKNGYERQRYGKAPPTRASNNRNESYREKKPEVKIQEKPKEIPPEEETPVVAEPMTTESRSHSEKSSTVSELSSPTELSSGQNTPPEKLIVRKMEQKVAEDLNRNFGETLKENLTRAKKEEETEEEEEEEEEEERSKANSRKKKGKGKEELAPKPKRQKKRKKGGEEKGKRSTQTKEIDENRFFHVYGKTQDFLSKAWESMNMERSEPIPNFETILTAENDDKILETLGIVDKRNVPKLPLASDLLAFPAFGHDRPKQKFEDFFTSAALKDLQNEVFTKTNLTNMRSSKPEEFFASIVEYPGRDRGKKDNNKSTKKGGRSQENTSNKKVKPAKGVNKKVEEEEVKKEEPEIVKQGKLGIVDAVNTWLREQGDPEKVLSAEVLKELSHDDEQKNGLSNPIHASSAEKANGADDACIRVASASKDDGYVGTETETKKDEDTTRLYRSSSWDAKLSDIQMKKYFQFLRDAASWDRRKLKDATLRKHFKFIADSANFLYRDVFGDIGKGYEFAREELCDPRQSVSKYYTLSPFTLDSDRTIECEGEAFDALDYGFSGKNPELPGNPSVTDSGVHSDSESNEEATAASESNPPIPNKEVLCKMQ